MNFQKKLALLIICLAIISLLIIDYFIISHSYANIESIKSKIETITGFAANFKSFSINKETKLIELHIEDLQIYTQNGEHLTAFFMAKQMTFSLKYSSLIDNKIYPIKISGENVKIDLNATYKSIPAFQILQNNVADFCIKNRIELPVITLYDCELTYNCKLDTKLKLQFLYKLDIDEIQLLPQLNVININIPRKYYSIKGTTVRSNISINLFSLLTSDANVEYKVDVIRKGRTSVFIEFLNEYLNKYLNISLVEAEKTQEDETIVFKMSPSEGRLSYHNIIKSVKINFEGEDLSIKEMLVDITKDLIEGIFKGKLIAKTEDGKLVLNISSRNKHQKSELRFYIIQKNKQKWISGTLKIDEKVEGEIWIKTDSLKFLMMTVRIMNRLNNFYKDKNNKIRIHPLF